MPNFSFEELTDIHFVYGLADGNSLQAQRFYAQRFPNRRLPHRRTFVRVHRTLRERGNLRNSEKSGRPATVTTVQTEQRILDAVEADPSTSVRRLSHEEGVSKTSVWRILKSQLLYPYHIQRVQGLSPRDFRPRSELCHWFLRKIALIPLFLSKILFTDEAGFSREGIFNYHNNHFWADVNPHEISQRRHQVRFSVNVWLGVIGDVLLGPVFLPNRLNGASYLDFLRNMLPELLDDMTLHERATMWFMQDGAPPHFTLDVRRHLNVTFRNRWIARGGPVAWPARSPDLNPLDFFVWGYLKSLVYQTPVENVAELRERIVNGCNVIRQIPGVFERVRVSLSNRLDRCIDMNGGHFEHML